MKKILLLLVFGMMFTSCLKEKETEMTVSKSEMVASTTDQPTVVNSTLQEGIIVGMSTEVVTHDSSNHRAVNGALIGGAASYLLSSRPSMTKTLLGAGAGAVVGKTTGGDITQTTTYILTIKNLATNTIIQKETSSSGFMVKDTVNYDNYSDIVFKKTT